MNINMTKWQVSVLAEIHILLPFYLILTRGPKIIVKNLRVILSQRMFFKVALIKVLFLPRPRDH